MRTISFPRFALSITHKSPSPLPARQAGGPVWKARRIERISRQDPCRLVRQVNQFWAPVRDLRSCQTSWQGAGDDALSFLACQTGVPATQGGRGETKIVGNTEREAWERGSAGRVRQILTSLASPTARGGPNGTVRTHPSSVQPGRYLRLSRASASAELVTRPAAPSYSIFWPTR